MNKKFVTWQSLSITFALVTYKQESSLIFFIEKSYHIFWSSCSSKTFCLTLFLSFITKKESINGHGSHCTFVLYNVPHKLGAQYVKIQQFVCLFLNIVTALTKSCLQYWNVKMHFFSLEILFRFQFFFFKKQYILKSSLYTVYILKCMY